MTPFDRVAPIAGLAVLSLLTAIGLLLVVRATSDQARISAVKRAIRANLFEIRLFNDDLRLILRAQGEILRHNLTYLRLSAAPLLWVAVPLLLLMVQLQFYYGYEGLEPGRQALVTVRFTAGAQQAGPDPGGRPALALVAPPGIRVETPMLWVPSLHEAVWRIAADSPGEYELAVRVDGRTVTKTVQVSETAGRRSPIRLERSLLNQLLYPVESPLPDASRLESIAVSYPERAFRILGWDVHWMVVFFALSMVFAFALRRRFGVVL